MAITKTFTAELEDRTLVVVPLGSVSSLAAESIKPDLDDLIEQLRRPEVKNVVIDFAKVSYFDTTMLGALHNVWKTVREGGGRMALCNVSAVGGEILRIAGFDTLWPICPSRSEALAAVRK